MKEKPGATIAIVDPKTQRRYETDPMCRCGHLHDFHIKEGLLKSCSKCPCPAFSSVKVHGEISQASRAGWETFLVVALFYFASIVGIGIWWMLLKSFILTVTRVLP